MSKIFKIEYNVSSSDQTVPLGQGRRRPFESGPAIDRRQRSQSADGRSWGGESRLV